MGIDFTPFWFLFSLGNTAWDWTDNWQAIHWQHPQIMSSPAVKDTTRFSHAHPQVWTLNPGTLLCTKSPAKQVPFCFLFVFFGGGDFHENWFHPPSGPTTDGEVGSCQEMDGLATKFFYWSYCKEISLRCTRAWWVPKRKEQQGVGIVQIRPLLLQFFFGLSFILPRTHDSLLLLLLMPACLQRMVERTI